MSNSQQGSFKTALVLGATGGVGGAVARALLARCPEGWAAHHLAVDLDGVRTV